MMKRLKKLITALLVSAMCFTSVACGNTQNNTDNFIDNDSSLSEEIKTVNTYTGIEMSDNLDDFIFKIDDVVYQMPIQISAFTKTGWLCLIILMTTTRK